LFAARRLTSSLWIALLVVALEIVIFPRTYSYPKTLAYALGFLAMWRYVEQPIRVVELAIVVVLAFGLRHDHGIYLGVGALLTVMAVAIRDGRREVIRRAAIFSGIVVLFLSPYIVYTAVFDGLWRHIRRGIELQAVESGRGRAIPWFTMGPDLLEANAVPWLYFLFHLLPVIAALVLWMRWRQRGPHEAAMVVPLIVVALLADLGLIRETVSARLPDAVVPATLLSGWLVSVALRTRVPARGLVWITTAAMVVLTMRTAAAVGGLRENLERAEMLGGPARLLQHIGNRTAEFHERLPAGQMPSRVAFILLPFFAYVDRCFGPRDHIFIPAYAPEVPVWSRRLFAGGEVWFQPGLLRNPEDDRQVISRLAEQRVPVGILLSPSSAHVMRQSPEIGQYVNRHLTERITLHIDDGRDLVIAFNPGIAVGRDRETGWPCYR
jgi:hypothetical protein